MASSNNWVLYAGTAPESPAPVPLEPWVRSLASGARVTIGDLEDGVQIPEAVPSGWQCAVLPDYILPHTLVAAIATPDDEYAMVFLTSTSANFHRQERPPADGLLGWFHVRLSQAVTDRSSLVINIQHAIEMLRSNGVFSFGAREPRGDA